MAITSSYAIKMPRRAPKRTRLQAAKKRQVPPRRRPVPTRRRASRAHATTVLAQGVGSVPSRPFGSVRARPSLACWDAKTPQHLSLPRPVGPYTTVRTTRRISTDRACMIFGAFKRPEESASNAGEWSNTCAIGSILPGTAQLHNSERVFVQLSAVFQFGGVIVGDSCAVGRDGADIKSASFADNQWRDLRGYYVYASCDWRAQSDVGSIVRHFCELHESPFVERRQIIASRRPNVVIST